MVAYQSLIPFIIHLGFFMPSSDNHAQKLLIHSDTSGTINQQAASVPPWYYRLIIMGLKPLYRLQVWYRSHQQDYYQQEVAQRFGEHYPPRPLTAIKNRANQVIWCHAVSLGETNTAAPLLDALLASGYQIWLTNTTQTGFARGASRFANEIASGRMSHSYVPVDSPAVIATFLAHVQPIAALFIETELWANILAKLSEQRIPSIVVNGRLSAASFTRYQKIGAVSASMMQNLSLIIAQDSDSGKRFRQLGADSAKIRIAGSLKWVIYQPTIENKTVENETQSVETQSKIALPFAAENEPSSTKKRPVWIAASTHHEEEAIALVLQQHIIAIPALAAVLLVIVPRHPERFDEVATLIDASGLQMARRSLNEDITPKTQVYLADSMGELMHWYPEADVALVGGSLVDIGGHNPVEPASVATPILMGKHTQSCQKVVDKLAAVGALYQPNNAYYRALVSDDHKNPHRHSNSDNASELSDDTVLIEQQLRFWLTHLPIAKRAGQAGEQLTRQQQDILPRQLAMIEQVIDTSVSAKPL